MVKHIVLFKLKDEAPADKKLTAMKENRKDMSWLNMWQESAQTQLHLL